MNVIDILLRLGLGAGIGFFIGLTGIGGGVLVLPALTIFLGLPASVAIGTASVYAFLTKSIATYQHFKLKTIDLSISILFLLGAIPGALISSVWINKYLSEMSDNADAIAGFQHILKYCIASVVLLSGIILIVNKIKGKSDKEGSSSSPLGTKLDKHPSLRRIVAISMGLIVGVLIGATSIGGGVLIVPMLIILFGLSSSKTVGTSIFIAVALTLTTSLVYWNGSQMDIKTALIMAAGSLVCVQPGSKLSTKMPEKHLQNLVIAVIIIAAIVMFTGQGH
ncbi:MAG: sulfite exporter TauE/SafE family protein [Kiritimatiellae bacterium]|nr:sulfite exporter TauE/SafE family protein [Kiritimatiellia bacterium]